MNVLLQCRPVDVSWGQDQSQKGDGLLVKLTLLCFDEKLILQWALQQNLLYMLHFLFLEKMRILSR